MRVFAIANQKGGVGKTTTTINLAAPLAAAGRKILVLDLDPHGSLTSYLGYNPDSVEKSSYQLFKGLAPDPRSLVLPTEILNLDLMAANSALATLDRQLGVKDGQGLAVISALKKLKDDYAYVFIDCPPVLGVLMVNALAACERLVIPVQSEYLALKGLERMIHTLKMITLARGSALPYLVVPTMYDRRTRIARESLDALRDTYPYNIWNEVIPLDTQFRVASNEGVPLTQMKPSSRGSIAYRRLLTFLLRQTYENDRKLTAEAV
ncbi:MAG TPA: ParA family protein [Gammaproteobacteria bacterium]|nr:ParA family protein [Gammaproteobacteria bacterium]